MRIKLMYNADVIAQDALMNTLLLFNHNNTWRKLVCSLSYKLVIQDA